MSSISGDLQRKKRFLSVIAAYKMYFDNYKIKIETSFKKSKKYKATIDAAKCQPRYILYKKNKNYF